MDQIILLLQDTGRLPEGGKYSGPPIHTLTVFANPPIKDVPEPWGEGVMLVEPGQEVVSFPSSPLSTKVPSEGAWSTLYFLPGTHDIGRNYRLHAER